MPKTNLKLASTVAVALYATEFGAQQRAAFATRLGQFEPRLTPAAPVVL